jgi:hypothetical protein
LFIDLENRELLIQISDKEKVFVFVEQVKPIELSFDLYKNFFMKLFFLRGYFNDYLVTIQKVNMLTL